MWILYTLVYGVLKGCRDVLKKESMKKSTVMEVLFFYTLIAFLLICPDAKNAVGIAPSFLIWVALKAFAVFLAWIFSFMALKSMPISLYGVIDLSRVLFATLFAVTVLHESLTVQSVTGLILVITGLLLLKLPARGTLQGVNETVSPLMILFAVASCFLNACSGLMDKILMRDLTSAQLQFWYMLFMVIYYLVYILVTRTKIRFIASMKNPWIWLMAVLFAIGDRALFVANSYEVSRISIMTLLKQSSVVIMILAGKFLYKEKRILHKFICAGIVILGIVIAAIK